MVEELCTESIKCCSSLYKRVSISFSVCGRGAQFVDVVTRFKGLNPKLKVRIQKVPILHWSETPLYKGGNL